MTTPSAVLDVTKQGSYMKYSYASSMELRINSSSFRGKGSLPVLISDLLKPPV
jgi:hypothetical protein